MTERVKTSEENIQELLHWVLPFANCVTEHACLFFAGHAYTSKVAFASLSLQMSFPHRAPWKIRFCSEPLPWLWLSCALAPAWPSPFHKPLCICRGFFAAIVPLQCLKGRRVAAIHGDGWCSRAAVQAQCSEGKAAVGLREKSTSTPCHITGRSIPV